MKLIIVFIACCLLGVSSKKPDCLDHLQIKYYRDKKPVGEKVWEHSYWLSGISICAGDGHGAADSIVIIIYQNP